MKSGTNGSPSARLRKLWFPALAFALLAIPMLGMWELLRADRPYAIRVSRLLIVFIALLSLAIVAFVTGYFTTRQLLADATVTHKRLEMAMASGRAVGWEWDLASGRNYWFGDLQTMFGIQGDDWSGHVDEFFRHVHPEDRQRVAQAVTDARVNHKLYKAEFRLVREDGAIRWVTGTGSFYYGKDGKPERMLGMAVDITELKHAEEGLKKSEEKFSKAFRESPLALTITSADDHRYLDINETFEQITGWRRDQVIGRTPFDIQIWVAPEERVEFVKRLRTEGSVRNYEVHFRCKDGAERIGLGSAELIEIDNESCILSVIADITETKRTEEKLSESQTRLSGVIDSAMDAIIAIDEEQRILLFNAAAEKMFGCSANDALGTSIERFIPPHLSSSHGQYVKQFGESGTTTGAMGNLGALSAVRLNGEEFPIEASISHLGVNRKKLFTAIIRDVTERRRAEEAERQSEERTHLAFQVGRMYADEWDADNDVILRSPECMSILGADQSPRTTRGELLRSVHPDDREQLASFFAGFTLEHSTNQVSYRFERPDGSVIWLEKRAQAFFDDNASLLRTIGVVADITDRKQSDLALRESEERFRLVANSAPVMIWTSGPNKMCDYFNQQWLNFTGRPLAAELGNGWAEGVHPEDLDACLNTYSQAFDKHEPFDMQYRIRRHDGQYRWIQDRGGPRFGPDGCFVGYIGSCNDVTDREVAAEVLGTLGRRLLEAHEQERTWIARELHDDINQRLALLAIQLEDWKRQGPESLDPSAHFEQARKRVFDISKDVQALSHRLHSSKLEYLGVVTAVKSFCRELSDQHKVRVEFSHSDVPRNLPSDVSLALFRVVQEALQNAVKHSRVQDFIVELRGTAREILLTVSDLGTGFDTREASKSLGLGLISMQERLQLVNGALTIESKPGQGTIVRARVPIQTDAQSELLETG